MKPVDLGAPAFAWVVGLGLLAGPLILRLYRRCTNPTRLRRTVNRIIAHLLEINLFSKEPRVVLRAQGQLLLENARLLAQLVPPSLILVALLAALNFFFGHAPLRPGASTLVTTPQGSLTASPGVTIDQPPVFIQTDRQLVWQIHITGPINGQLTLLPSISRTVCVTAICAVNPFASTIKIAYPPVAIFHYHWLWWFSIASILGALFGRQLSLPALLCLTLSCTTNPHSQQKLIVLGIDGMDPTFVERHWDSLPNLKALRDIGHFCRLATTTPPQSPVAWSSFITGLDPAQHGIYDFVGRDPATLTLFSSLSKTEDPRFVLPLGPYLIPLSSARVSSGRKGTPFWRTLANHGISASIQHIPVNYPPEPSGRNLSGMGVPDLLGTLGAFTFFTDDPLEASHSVSGGRIVKAEISNGRAILALEGPPNPFRRDHSFTATPLTLDVDPTNPIARLQIGDQSVIIHQGEWSPWLTAEFPLISRISTLRGEVRIYAKHLHPTLQIYVSPINIDPALPALPISYPNDWSSAIESEIGPYSTLGIPEDTSALRQEVLTLPEFLQQSHLVFLEEAKLLNFSLRHFTNGFLFFYFSCIDQNSHVLWGKHDDELFEIYREMDDQVGIVRRAHPDAELLIISDHGFTTFNRAVNLNAWLAEHGFLKLKTTPGADANLQTIDWPATQAYALGLNALYLNLQGRERFGTVPTGQAANALLSDLRLQLLSWRDPVNGRAIIETVTPTNDRSAPDLIIGYAPGYRASWQTALGETRWRARRQQRRLDRRSLHQRCRCPRRPLQQPKDSPPIPNARRRHRRHPPPLWPSTAARLQGNRVLNPCWYPELVSSNR